MSRVNLSLSVSAATGWPCTLWSWWIIHVLTIPVSKFVSEASVFCSWVGVPLASYWTTNLVPSQCQSQQILQWFPDNIHQTSSWYCNCEFGWRVTLSLAPSSPGTAHVKCLQFTWARIHLYVFNCSAFSVTNTGQLLHLLLLQRAVKDLRGVGWNQTAGQSDNEHGGEGRGRGNKALLGWVKLHMLHMLWT